MIAQRLDTYAATTHHARRLWTRAVPRQTAEIPAPRTSTDAPATEPCTSELYLELARRTAELLERQQALLDTWEQDEVDADRLDQLFALDHLAAQARRQAESLRILAGGPTVRRPEELSLDDVLHAAVSSVQDYRRVQIETPAGHRVTADAAGDVVHLLTEAIDRALVSSAASVVVVTTRRAGADVMIEIHDDGETSGRTRLTELNALLAEPTVAVAATAGAGAEVLGRLARQHGIEVGLRAAPHGGTVTSVSLPAALLVVAADEPEPRQVLGRRAAYPDVDQWATVVPLAKPDTSSSAGHDTVRPRHRAEGPALGLAGQAV